ncbi:MAG: multidrug ABC transporter permease [Thermotogae bacterium]|nr:multidrug ABC transporter permease [Thermotogota bacterium]
MGSLRLTLKKLKVLIEVYYAYMLEYRAEIVLWMLSGILPFILMAVWMNAATRSDFGYSPVDFARYFLAVFITHQMTTVWVIWEFEHDVLRGQLSPYLLQPMDPVWRYVSSHVAERLSRFPFLLLLVLLFFLLYPRAIWIPSPRELLLFFLVGNFAFAVRFLLQYSLAMLSFWIERATAFEELHMLLFLFLSGYVAPLELFPEGVRSLILWTPFPYMIDFPVRILLGGEVELARGLTVMGVWFVVLLLLNRLLWRLGLAKYSAMGA